jgi:hypothetical protein
MHALGTDLGSTVSSSSARLTETSHSWVDGRTESHDDADCCGLEARLQNEREPLVLLLCAVLIAIVLGAAFGTEVRIVSRVRNAAPPLWGPRLRATLSVYLT